MGKKKKVNRPEKDEQDNLGTEQLTVERNNEEFELTSWKKEDYKGINLRF